MTMQPESVPKRRSRMRYVVNLLVAGIVAFPLVIFSLGVWQGAANSDEYFRPYRNSLCCTPAKFGLEYEDVAFVTDDGLTLSGWYLPAQNGVAIIVAHGLHHTRESTFNIAITLQKHGYGVLAFDIRGHGTSEGELIVDMYQDGLAAVSYLKSRPEIEHIGAYGFSLGGVLMIQAAALNDEIEAIVTDGAGFAEYEDIPAPTSVLEWLYAGYDFAFFNITKPRFGSYGPTSITKAVAKITPRPQMFIASDTEWRMVEGYYNAAGEPKTYWYIQGINHGAGSTIYPDEYEAKLIAFYDAAFEQSEP